MYVALFAAAACKTMRILQHLFLSHTRGLTLTLDRMRKLVAGLMWVRMQGISIKKEHNAMFFWDFPADYFMAQACKDLVFPARS